MLSTNRDFFDYIQKLASKDNLVILVLIKFLNILNNTIFILK